MTVATPKTYIKKVIANEKLGLVSKHIEQFRTNVCLNESNFQSIGMKEHISLPFLINLCL